MKIYILESALVCMLIANVYGDDVKDNIDKQYSVKKLIDTAGEIEEKDVSVANEFKHMFSDAKVSGKVGIASVGLNPKDTAQSSIYATALGGVLKYELAEFQGFNAGVAFYTSHDINGLTGDNNKHNNELSSNTGHYTDLAQSYINYKYGDFNARVGRQVLDTPLADSDDIRMISNTFNAYVLTYDYKDITFMLGKINSWQGFDAGLDSGWSKIGSHGANFGGLTYDKAFELSAWYYNVTSQTNATYIELGDSYDITSNTQIHAMLQYLHETELHNSGMGADIYGMLLETFVYDLRLSAAYDKSLKKNGLQSFSGFGGGALFTSMDTMILDNIAQDREASALTAGLTYTLNDFNFLYAYGDFKGDADSLNVKAHIVEQDMGFEYNFNDAFSVAAIYAYSQDKESSLYSANDWNRVQLLVNYNF